MNPFRTMLVTSAVATTATFAMATSSLVAPKSDTVIVRSDEISAAQRYYHHRQYVRPRYAPAYIHQPPYRGFADPSFGPDGQPYRVPEYLRNQCYVDMGYGRFQSCSNRN